MRIDAERAGFESLAVAAYFQGRARLAMQEGNLGAAIAALETGRRARPRLPAHPAAARLPRRVPRRAARWRPASWTGPTTVIRGMAEAADAYTMPTQTSVPGLQFHLACRRGRHRAGARAAPDGPRRGPRHRGAPAATSPHDLISAGARRRAAGATAAAGSPPRSTAPASTTRGGALVDAQIAEAARRPRQRPGRLRRAVAEPSMLLPADARHRPRRRRPLPDRARPTSTAARAARPRRRAAARPLVRLAGRRAAGAARAGSGSAPPRSAGDQALTPREREVAVLHRRGPDQRRAGPPAVHLAADRRRPRLQHPEQAQPRVPHADRSLGQGRQLTRAAHRRT